LSMGMEPKGRWTIEYIPELPRIPLPRTPLNRPLCVAHRAVAL
jgi:hypothetical protein